MFSIFIALTVIGLVKCEILDDGQYYNVAVFENVNRGNYETDTTKEYIERNLVPYQIAASIAAKNNADILCFAEFGLFPGKTRDKIIEDAQYVPDPKVEIWNPCLEPDRYENSYLLVNLSCMARQHNMVILANIVSKIPCNKSLDSDCPSDGVYMYNTNVAFNRTGLLIGRYRRTHLYFLDVNVLPEPEYIVFETDFGIIGTFTSLDIVYKEAVNLVERYSPDAVIFTSYWIDYFLPGMNYIQIQQSWAIGNNVTLFGVNRQHPRFGAAGSGVYFGETGISNYVYNPDGQSRVLISKVPRRGVQVPEDYPPPTIIEFGDNFPNNGTNNISSGVCSTKVLPDPINIQDFRCYEYDLSNFTLIKIESPNGVIEACNNGLCCNVQYNAELSDEDYYLAVINGTYTVGNRYSWWLETCILVRCDSFNGKECSTFPTKSHTVFSELHMEGNFTTSYVYPSVLVSGMQLIPRNKWSFSSKSLSLKTSNDNLLTATLYGRSYERDP